MIRAVCLGVALLLGLPLADAPLEANPDPALARLAEQSGCSGTPFGYVVIMVVVHEPHGYRTVYCHLAAIAVQAGDSVTRGQRLGTLGTSGQRAWPGYEHVHLELQRGTDRNDLHDPLPRIVGCFDAGARYPADRLALTYPVPC